MVEDIEQIDGDEESEVTCLIPLMLHIGEEFFYDTDDGEVMEFSGLWSKTK